MSVKETLAYFKKFVCCTSATVHVAAVTAALPAEVVPDVECTDPPKNKGTGGDAPWIDSNNVVIARTVVVLVCVLLVVEEVEDDFAT